MLTRDPIPLSDDAIDDVKAYLRIDTPDEDALIASLLTSAIARAEDFLGQMLIIRNVVEAVPARRDWQVLGSLPVTSISQLNALAIDGTTTPLTPAQFSVDIMADGSGWVRVVDASVKGRVTVNYSAGYTAGWDSLPEAVRLGVIRLTAYLYTSRDAQQDAGPPAVVMALLRPFRRMRLI